jgi:hypothetical protein
MALMSEVLTNGQTAIERRTLEDDAEQRADFVLFGDDIETPHPGPARRGRK